ncbi:MAG: CoA transferase [Chloroflexota bacterium]|nr:CoA transferase [Chloroflexota bacterium]
MTALSGVRVLDLTRLLPGPFCTQLLADLGADVLKVEEPTGGDPARRADLLNDGTGALFRLVNRNKRSLTLNLKTSEGRGLLLRLVDRADVLVDSFRPGVLDRLGLAYSVLAARNPRLVHATLSGFGQTGPYRDRPGHDLNYVALAGLLAYNVDADGAPVMPSVQVADLGGALFAAVAILAALVARQSSGHGQFVDVSLYGSALAWLPTLVERLFATGRPPAAGEPPLAGGLPQYGIYRTADGAYVTLGAIEPRFLHAFLKAVGREDLADLAGREELRSELGRIFAARSRAEWVALLERVDTCFAPVNSLEEALRDPQATALGMLTELAGGQLIGVPMAFSATPASMRRAPPSLGEHTTDVLGELGLAEHEVAALRARGVV